MLIKKIVLIEDEISIAELIKASLPAHTYTIDSYENAEDGIAAIKTHTPDILILDWELPDISGPDVIRIIRSDKRIAALPIIMLTVRNSSSDISVALDLGADEYITKPFKPKELVSRINAFVRRLEMKNTGGEIVKKGIITINISQRTCFVKNKKKELTDKEYQLLYLLIKNAGRTVTTSEIIEKIWGSKYDDDGIMENRLRVLVQRLKVSLGGECSDMIKSKYKLGYSFNHED